MTALFIIFSIIFLGNMMTSNRKRHFYHQDRFPKYRWHSSYDEPYLGDFNADFMSSHHHYRRYERDENQKAMFYTFMFIILVVAILVFLKN